MSGFEPYADRELRLDVWLPVLQEALAKHGRFIFPLRGNSMQPTLPHGCIVAIVPLAGAPRLGQLIVFAVGDGLVAHRLVQRREALWIAQGDNRRGPDCPLKLEQVLGIVSAAYVEGRKVWPRHSETMRVPFWLARYHLFRAARWVAQPTRRLVKP